MKILKRDRNDDHDEEIEKCRRKITMIMLLILRISGVLKFAFSNHRPATVYSRSQIVIHRETLEQANDFVIA